VFVFGGLKASKRGSRDEFSGTTNKRRAVTGLPTSATVDGNFDRKREECRNDEDSQLL
jgi:hypothetical protein